MKVFAFAVWCSVSIVQQWSTSTRAALTLGEYDGAPVRQRLVLSLRTSTGALRSSGAKGILEAFSAHVPAFCPVLRCRGGEAVSEEGSITNQTAATRDSNKTFADFVWSKEFSEKSDPLFMMGLNTTEQEAASKEFVKQIMTGEEDAFQVMENLKDQGNTAMAAAESLKSQGNKNFTALYRQAIRLYTQALQKTFPDDTLRIVCLANRAAAHLCRSNSGHALRDCKDAIAIFLNSRNLKGCLDTDKLYDVMLKCYTRAAKACLRLEKFSEAQAFCASAAALNQSCEVVKKVSAAVAAGARRASADAERKAREIESQRKQLFTVKDIVRKRGIIIGAALYPDILEMQLVDVTAEGSGTGVLWPLLFIYDEHCQSDFLRQCSEGSTVAQQLAEVLDPAAPPPAWDPGRRYTPATVAVYFVTFQTPVAYRGRLQWLHDPATGRRCEQRLVMVDKDQALVDVMRADGHVVPRFPVLHVTVAGSAHERHLLARPCAELLPPVDFGIDQPG